MPSEKAYIRKRKRKAFIHSLAYRLCEIFPVRKNKVTVVTFEGKGGFGCNPKYIVQELHRRHPDVEIVWLLNDLSKEFPEYIKKKKYTLWNRAYHLSTSKVWIDNYRKPLGTVKRKGQYYLNTNHYTIGIKCTGLWRGEGFSEMAYLVSKADSDMVDDLITDSKWTMDVSPKGFVYDGHFLNTGAPRCDVLYGDRTKYKDAFRKKHNIPLDSKVVMYAPTFREGAKDGKRFVFSEVWSIDFERLLSNMEERFGGTWYLCIRVHPQLAPTFKEYKNEKVQDRIVDESQSDDMYEILAGMDAYITDYSSAIFEAGFAHIPAFVYADDIEQYANDRGELMWNFATDPKNHVTNNKVITPEIDAVFPFGIATDNEELERKVLFFDNSKYIMNLELFHNEIELVNSGNSTNLICDTVQRKMDKTEN